MTNGRSAIDKTDLRTYILYELIAAKVKICIFAQFEKQICTHTIDMYVCDLLTRAAYNSSSHLMFTFLHTGVLWSKRSKWNFPKNLHFFIMLKFEENDDFILISIIWFVSEPDLNFFSKMSRFVTKIIAC